MTHLATWLLAVHAALMGQSAPPVIPQNPSDFALSNSIRVELRAPRTTVPVGGEVLLEFAVINKTDEPVKLSVPGALVGKERLDLGSGLPLEHIFSGENFRGLEVAAEENIEMGDRIVRKPDMKRVPIRLGVDGDGMDPKLPARTDHAYGDFTSIGD